MRRIGIRRYAPMPAMPTGSRSKSMPARAARRYRRWRRKTAGNAAECLLPTATTYEPRKNTKTIQKSDIFIALCSPCPCGSSFSVLFRVLSWIKCSLFVVTNFTTSLLTRLLVCGRKFGYNGRQSKGQSSAVLFHFVCFRETREWTFNC